MKTDLASRFPEAFALLHESRFRQVGEAFYDNQTGQTHPLKGLRESIAHSGRPWRVPLVVVEGPPQSGKTWLLNELSKISGAGITCMSNHQCPPPDSILTHVIQNGYPFWVIDCVQMKSAGRRLIGERMAAFDSFLTDDEWMLAPRKGHTVGRTFELRTVTVLVGCEVVLPADLERKAACIRLQAREQ